MNERMSYKHTPGPWEARVGNDATVWCPDGRHYNIGDAIYHPENVANARLVSAAPDLLDAANLALAGLMQPKAIDFEVLEEKLRTAIAKAEGR